MADTLDLILTGSPANAATPAQGSPQRNIPAPGGSDLLDLVLGGRQKATAVSSKDLTYDPSRTLGFIDQAKGSFAATDDQWKRIAAQALYPNEPVDAAALRFHRTSDGRYYHVGADGKNYEVQPPSGIGRLANLGEGVGGALPVIGGGAGLLVGWGPASIPAAAGGAYTGDVARQMIGNYLDPKQAGEYSQATALKEGALGGAGQAVGLGVNKLASRFMPRDIAYYNKGAANALADTAERMGVKLTPAETTGLESLKAEQKRLSGTVSAANEMGQFYRRRNQDVMRVWDDFLNTLSPPRDASYLGKQANQAADEVLAKAQAQRTARVDPLYKAAESAAGSVNPGDVVRYISAQLPNAKGSERNALQFAMKQLQLTGGDTIDMSFRGLNGAKMAIDAMLENPDLAAKQGIDRTAHATLQRVRSMIIDAIDRTPGGPMYANARETYGQITERGVTPIQEILAPLLRVNNANSSVVRAAQSVLDPATRSPMMVAQARRLLERDSPEVWQGIKRQFLQERAVKALQENAKGDVTNVGGNIAKRVGDDATEANMRAAMTQGEFRAYQDIIDVFRATGRAIDQNSDTAFKMASLERAKNQAGGWLARIIRNVNPSQALKNTSDFFQDRNYERQAEAIARIFTSGNQDAIRQLRALRQFSPSDVRRQVAIGHILARSGYAGGSALLNQ